MKATAVSLEPVTPLVELLDAELGDELDGLPRHLWERALGTPAREFLRRPGKQFRARLVEVAWSMVGGKRASMPAELPLIVELLHAGSLIVDDIEDASEWRRGAPALHRVVDLPLALNTGNWMYFWPLELIDELPLDERCRSALLREAYAAVSRCHRGQALDLSMRVTELDQHELPEVVRATTRLKTGALMELAAVMGAVAAGGSSVQVAALRKFARQLGAGLQMLDDLGGIVTEERRHKGDEDLRNARPTWPWAWAARTWGPKEFELHQRLAAEVVAGRASTQRLAGVLARQVAVTGRERIHASLHLSLAELQSTFGSRPQLRHLADEITRLETSYV